MRKKIVKKKSAINGYTEMTQYRLIKCETCNDGEEYTNHENCPSCGKRGSIIMEKIRVD